MAANEVTGKTPEQLKELEAEWEDRDKDADFEDAYCLTKIQRQPDDYDGPTRYCSQRTLRGRDDFCVNHEHYENLDKLANMQSGVKALRENLKEDFTEAEQEAYDTIMEEWPEYYDIEDPSSLETLESLAVELVREVRADMVVEEYRTDNPRGDDRGFTKVKDVFGPEGGVVGTEDVPNYILEERRKCRRLIEKMKDNLGITRKHQDRMDAEEEKANSIDTVTQGISDAIEGGEYNPDDFQEDDGST